MTPTYYLRVREMNPMLYYVWLCRKDGKVHSGVLHGQVMDVDALVEWAESVGIKVEREELT